MSELNQSQKNYILFTLLLKKFKKINDEKKTHGATWSWWRIYKDRYKSGTTSVKIYGLDQEQSDALKPLCDEVSEKYYTRFLFRNLPKNYKVNEMEVPDDIRQAFKVLEVTMKLDKVL